MASLIYLFDRIASPTLFYLTTAYGFHLLRHVLYTPLAYGIILLCLIFWGKAFIFSVSREIRLHGLGGRSPAIRTRTLWNVGMLMEMGKYFAENRSDEYWWLVFGKYGKKNRPYTVEAIAGGERLILTADEDNIKAVLASQFADYGKGPQFRKTWRDFLGLSIFTTDGDLWHTSRALLRPQFVKDRVSDLHTFEKHVQVLLPLLAGSHNGATTIVDDLFYRFALDSSADFLFGHGANSLTVPNGEWAAALSAIQAVQGKKARAGPFAEWIPKGDFHKNLGVFNALINQYIDRALALPADELEKLSKNDQGFTFLHAIAARTRDRVVLRDEIVAVLLAGRDSTAVTLAWLFYQLSRHPEVVRKLRAEIAAHVGLDPARQPTYEDLKNMRYLRFALNETLRLYPVVPYNVRTALKDTTLPRGGGEDGSEPIGVLEGTPIVFSTLILQRRPDLYPDNGAPDLQEFAPERWEMWTPNAWTYIPFNGGPRICIGQQFALTEMQYTVVRILQVFDRIECRMPAPPMWKTEVALQPHPDIRVAFFKDT